MARVDYSRNMDSPALRTVCETCTVQECPGLCDRFREEYRRVFNGKQPRAKHQKCQDYKQEYEVDGLIMTMREWADACGIRYGTLWSRVHNSNMSMKEALTTKRVGLVYTVGDRAMTAKQWAEEIGITLNYMYVLLHKGLTMTEIVGGKREPGGSYYYRIGRFKRI